MIFADGRRLREPPKNPETEDQPGKSINSCGQRKAFVKKVSGNMSITFDFFPKQKMKVKL
jgi:hypothetical protein